VTLPPECGAGACATRDFKLRVGRRSADGEVACIEFAFLSIKQWFVSSEPAAATADERSGRNVHNGPDAPDLP
jgi:hypothetical protein